MRTVAWVSTMAIALSGPGALAQSADPAPEDAQICVGVLNLWSGSLAETATIESQPVPDSYRAPFRGTACNSLHKPALISWHLAFGSEASTSAALAFLSDELGGDARSSRTISRRIDAASLLASEHLRAAEFHGSAEMLARAQAWLAVLANAVDTAARPEGEADRTLPPLLFDLKARALLLRARLSGRADDRAAARARLDIPEAALFSELGAAAYSDGGFCPASDPADTSEPTPARRLCDSEPAVEWRTTDYLVNRARLALMEDVPGRTPPRDVEMALGLLRHHAVDSPGGRGILRPQDDRDAVAALLLRLAEWHARGGTDETEGAALHILTDAIRHAPADQNPGRFRQLATLYLRLWDRLPATARAGRADLARTAAMVRRLSAQLSPIAIGE